jgi:hypothetical protein
MSNPTHSRELVEGFIDGTLDDVRLTELKQLLQTDPDLRASMAMEMRLRGLLRARRNDSSGLGDSVAKATDGFSPQRHDDGIIDAIFSRAIPSTIPFKSSLKTTNRFARAAVWLGAFTWFGNKANASAVVSTAAQNSTQLTIASISILMKKTVTSITAAILVLGGSGIYVIHRNNGTSRNRLASMETEIQSLNDQLGIKTTSLANRRAGKTNSQKTVSITQVSAIHDGDNLITRQEGEIIDRFKKQLAGLDAEGLKTLLLDAEKLSNPINGHLVQYIMKELISKDPAGATQLAMQLTSRGLAFQFHLSHQAADAFRAWQAKDPAAADAWYVATAAAGGLNSKNIPPNGLENLAIDRSFARLRFAAQMKTNPTEAASMMATMLPDDVTAALKEVTNPETLLAFLPNLPPERRGPAAEGAIKVMASTDLKAAFTWAKSLEMDEPSRNHLMATGIETAVGNGKLDLAGVSEWSKDLSLDAKRRSDMLASAAASVSLIPRKNPNVVEVENSVYWDRVAGSTDWLRKEAPAGSAGEAVGDYLGKLSYNSRNLDQSIKAYESEVARQGEPDPDLTITFARWLSMSDDDQFSAAALKLLKQLPPSEKRNDRIQLIEMNR